ncbi:unnamed protein product [Diabrotica balteata]|uniref:Uncharacterized protein n=1 Tax=Diabrotica balteata TaxID=107213 RepID=A0A9N9XGG2_DIABA|nr:unnamed protein product [Diabrotica balteata]
MLGLSLQINSLSISLLEEDIFTECLPQVVEDCTYHTHILIINGNFTENFMPRFSKISLDSNNLNLLHSFNSAPNLFTISYSSLDELNTTLLDIFTERKVTRVLSHFIILTADPLDLFQISQLLWKYNFYKSLILLKNGSIVELYVIDYTNSNCGKIITYKKINECKDNRYKHKLKSIKPDMKQSFNQCSLMVGVSYSTPLINYVNDSLPGIIPELLTIVSTSSGYRFDFYQDDCYLDEVKEYRIDSLLKDSDSGKIDMLFISNYVSYQKFFFVPAIYDPAIILVPKPKQLPYWKNNVLAYQLPVWCCIYAMIPLLSIIVLGYAKLIQTEDTRYFGSSFINNILMVLGLSLNMPARYIPVTWNLRILLGFYMFFCLLELTYRQAKITSLSALSVYEKRVRNMEDLIDSDIPFKSFAAGLILFQSNKRLISKIQVLSESEEEFKGLAVLIFPIQIKSLNTSLIERDTLTECFQQIVEYASYHTHIFITSENFTENFIPRFSKISVGSNNLYLLHSFRGAPNLFTITYSSLDELNTTLLDISTERKVSRILSHFIILTTSLVDLTEISHLLWSYSFYKSLILLKNELLVELYVIDYKNSNCGKIIKYKKINECKDSKYKLKLKPIKPNMKLSFSQCPLTVGVSFLTPMVNYVNYSFPGIIPELLTVVSTSSGYKFDFYQDECYLNELRDFRFDSLFEHFDTGKIDMVFISNYFLDHKLFFVPTM